MEQSKLAKCLKIATIAVAFVGAAVFFVLIPIIGRDMTLSFSEVAYMYWPCLIFTWIIAGLCFASLAAFYPVCTRIGRNDSFCMENARAMRVISWLIAVCVFVLACGLIALSLLHMMMPIIAIGIPLLIVLFAAISVATGVLARLIEKASALQSDIDLTI
jgi:hypothetical protein